MIYIIGDTHGEIEYHKMSNNYFQEQGLSKPTKNDIMVHVGDIGLVWDLENNITPTEKYLKKWISERPCNIITAGGNHENWDRIFKLPLVSVPWLGDKKAYKYTDNMYYAQRGIIYEINNKKFFFMGGAQSTDIDRRVPGLSWWEEEVPSMKEMENGIKELDNVNMKVDYVVSHTLPRQILQLLGFYNRIADPTAAYLDNLLSFKIKFKKWFGGHFHIDEEIQLHDKTFYCVNNEILKINE